MRKFLVIGIVALAACSGSDDTTQPPSSTVDVTTTSGGYADANAVIQAINDNGLACTQDTVDDNEPGGGAASVEFCTIGTNRIQVVTFADDTGKTTWLNLASQVAKDFPSTGCAVGDMYAACPDTEVTDPAVVQHLADALGAEVTP